ncbi:hypothetical protein FBD94_13085 [Pedobacter hiemivivus]|nr:hypothetical protein [Pedobacter hiemivivus]TKC61457.1 hypothetical protein FBD94_13085 [Pedobacter hiemivivus]
MVFLNAGDVHSQKLFQPSIDKIYNARMGRLYADYLAADVWLKTGNTDPSSKKMMEATFEKLDIDHALLIKGIKNPVKYIDTYFNLRKLVKGEERCTSSDMERASYLLYNVKNTALKKMYFNKVLKAELGREGLSDQAQSLFNDAKLVIKDEVFIANTKILLDKYKLIERGAISPQFSLKTSKGEILTPASFKGKVLVMQVLCGNASIDSASAQKKAFEKVADSFAGKDSILFVRIDMGKNIKPGNTAVEAVTGAHVLQLSPLNKNEFTNQFMLMSLTRHMIISDQKIMYSHLPDIGSIGVFVNVAKMTTEINKNDE